MTVGKPDVRVRSLRRGDPPAVGSIELQGRLGEYDAGIVYAGTSEDDLQVAVVILNEGAEQDSFARARFSEAVQELQTDEAGVIVAADFDPEIAAWVALAVDEWSEGVGYGHELLTAVTLENRSPIGAVHGPEFRPHWHERIGVGRWRLWPLPWPARLTDAGRWTFIASFALVMAIAAIALLIAVKVFENQAPPPPGPGPGPGPVPPPTSPTPTPSTTPPGPSPSPRAPPSSGHPVPPIV
ncbi:MAG: hypothetical protein ABJA81_00245 [Nocardioidaceae bacterium]